MEKLLLPLSVSQDVTLVGGKSASLASLVKAKFNVPAGFVITAGANNTFNAGLEKEILEAFDELGAERVAVRSSAVAEDGAKDAWAGQLDTFLNVRREGLIESVKKCWQSAKSERAKAYATHKGSKSGNVAVVIQKMIQSQVSGVAFSAHPVTGNREQAVIEAVKGLGEKLVSGIVTPDTYIIDKRTGGTIEMHTQAAQPVLAKKQIKELTEVVNKIEKFFGLPVDVEWALSESELFILQSRPITALG